MDELLQAFRSSRATPVAQFEPLDESDWGKAAGFGTDKDGLHRSLKYGPDPTHWNEFVFKGYHNHTSDAIFLTGIPDLKATLPHA
jgi:hypothetical protein